MTSELPRTPRRRTPVEQLPHDLGEPAMLAIERLDRSQRGAVTRAALVVDAYAALIPVIDRESVLDLAGRLARARLVQASCPRPTEHGESNRGIADRTVISARDRR